MDSIYGLETLSRTLMSGFNSVSLGAGLSLGLPFIFWNYLNSARLSLAGPLAAWLGLALGRFLFFSSMLLGDLWLLLAHSYLILGAGVGCVWQAARRNRAIKSEPFWSQGLVPANLPWPAGLPLGLALASLSRPDIDVYSLNLIIFGFKGQGGQLWLAWAAGNLVVLSLALIVFSGFYLLLKGLAPPAARYRLEQAQVLILLLTGFSLIVKSFNVF